MNEGAHTNSIQYVPAAEIIKTARLYDLIQHPAHFHREYAGQPPIYEIFNIQALTSFFFFLYMTYRFLKVHMQIAGCQQWNQ